MMKYPSMAFQELLYDTDKSCTDKGPDGMHSTNTEGAVWCHCKPAFLKSLNGCGDWPRFLHNV